MFGSIDKTMKFLRDRQIRAETYRGVSLMGLPPPGRWIAKVGFSMGWGDTRRAALNDALQKWKNEEPQQFDKAAAEWEALALAKRTLLATGQSEPRRI